MRLSRDGRSILIYTPFCCSLRAQWGKAHRRRQTSRVTRVDSVALATSRSKKRSHRASPVPWIESDAI